MGYSTSAYAFYGVHVPSDQWTERWATAEGEKMDAVLRALRGKVSSEVGHLEAGDYDRDMLFICASREGESVEVALGTFQRFPTQVDLDWKMGIIKVAQAMGYTGLDEPGWIVVPDVS